MKRLPLLAAALMLASGLPLSATTPDHPHKGHLVVIGGALDSGNDAIYEKILELGGPEAGIGIVPTASGVWESSSKSYVDDFTGRGAGERTEVIPVHMDDFDAARREDITEQIARQRILFFTGGDQSRIITAFRPEDGDLPSYHAMWKVLEKGGVIAGSSAGAAMMSDPCIRWGNSADAMLVGLSSVPDRGVAINRGMGFFPYGMTDQHFSERGRFGRLLTALRNQGIAKGYGVAENRAFHVDLENHTVSGLGGPQALIVIDVSDSLDHPLAGGWVASDGSLTFRVSLLGHGDTIHAHTGEVTPAPGRVAVDKMELTRKAREFKPDVHTPPAPLFTSDDVWGNQVIAHALASLTRSDVPFSVVRDENFELIFGWDSRTELYRNPGNEAEPLEGLDVLVANATLVVIAREGAPAAAEKLLAELDELAANPAPTE